MMIRTIEELYAALDELFHNIEKVCVKCKFSRCLGYVWLLPEEADELTKDGIEVLEVNREIFFINSFSDGKGGINVGKFKPKCPLLIGGRCRIYSLRPLSCRMYPLSFSVENGKVEIVLHLDCLFSREKADELFKKLSLKIFRETAPKLLEEISQAYKKVWEISKFPIGKNSYILLGALLPDERR